MFPNPWGTQNYPHLYKVPNARYKNKILNSSALPDNVGNKDLLVMKHFKNAVLKNLYQVRNVSKNFILLFIKKKKSNCSIC